jgi:hypothetical protein
MIEWILDVFGAYPNVAWGVVNVSLIGLFLFEALRPRRYRVEVEAVHTDEGYLDFRSASERLRQARKDAAMLIHEIEISIDKCPRCGKSHDNLTASPFGDMPIGPFTHWYNCPEEKDPALVSVTIRGEEAAEFKEVPK